MNVCVNLVETNYPTGNYKIFQLQLPLDDQFSFQVDDQVTSFVEIMKGIDTSRYFEDAHIHRGNQGYNPYMMLNVVLFAYMIKIPSLRDLESLCRNDIRFIYLANGETPSFAAFQRFISEKLTDDIEDIFYEIAARIIDLDNVDTSVLYIDGTKIEANARKNSFVWKKSILNRRSRLYANITDAVGRLNNAYHYEYALGKAYSSSFVWEITEDLLGRISAEGIELKYGIGNRKDALQKHYELFLDYAQRLSNYEMWYYVKIVDHLN